MACGLGMRMRNRIFRAYVRREMLDIIVFRVTDVPE